MGIELTLPNFGCSGLALETSPAMLTHLLLPLTPHDVLMGARE